MPELQALGAKHVEYGVLAENYHVVGQALLATLAAGLGDEWTLQVAEAWTTVYDVITKTMIGSNYD